MRGRQRRRRAITSEELGRLLTIAGSRRLLYLTAIYTGLRLRELGRLVWADLHLNETRPYLIARAGTTKNRKEAVQPLHPVLAAQLASLPRHEGDDARTVFSVKQHPERYFKNDLAKAKIESFDALGRKLDFHALRYTFATRLAKKGISQRLTQELMRHSDPALTANIYTDASQLPTYAAVPSSQPYTQIASQRPVPGGISWHGMATETALKKWRKPL